MTPTRIAFLTSLLDPTDKPVSGALLMKTRQGLRETLTEISQLRSALREMRDIARHFANVAGHSDDAVAIAANQRADELLALAKDPK